MEEELGAPPRRAARTWSDLQSTFHHFDSQRFAYLAKYLEDAGRPHIAELARKWSDEHRMVAAQLMKLG